MAKILLVVIAFLAGVSLSLAADWSYARNAADVGPNHWPGLCGSGTKQTPIDIHTNMTQYDPGLGALNLVNYGNTPAVNFTAVNPGYTLKVGFPPYVYNVSGGGLPGTYTTVQFHLHWGSVNTQGSEHAVDGKHYAAENHFVSYNVKYPNISVALGHPDGLAVLGVFLKVGSDQNTPYQGFLSQINLLINKSSEVSGIPAFPLNGLLPSDKTKYFRYNGSLTTPNCSEVVTWTVFRDPVEISQDQLNALRSLKMNSTMHVTNNYRPLQELNGRTVKASFMDSTSTAPPTIKTVPPTDSGIALKISTAVMLSMLFGTLFLI